MNSNDQGWFTLEIRAIVRSEPKFEHSLERNTYIRPEVVAQCDFMVDGRPVSYRTRFQLDENMSEFTRDSAEHLQPGTYLKLTRCKFDARKGRYEGECLVREFRVSTPEWTWVATLSQADRDLQYLQEGLDLKQIL